MRILVVYDTQTGNTGLMAEAVAQGVRDAGVEAVLRTVDEASIDELPQVQGLILGSPVYYGLPSGKIKTWIDESIKYHGKLTHLVAGAFCTAGRVYTGSETTILALLQSCLVHGMIVQGNPHGTHYGVSSKGAPGENEIKNCKKLGSRVAQLVKKLNP
ncbi:flavodoxin family protein [Candidatus Bathyarchaeota archaeon]|nr:flavodoxin family protein [Candidatus Bathyarchaeota archaeon]